MEVINAIRDRRAVRQYTGQIIEESTVRELIDAATLAPSAVNVQPWSFAVVQDPELLKKISDRAKIQLMHAHFPPELREMIADPKFNIFYNAGTLIVICAQPEGEHPDWDCCLAGENLMLRARELGLGTCVIGFAWSALDMPEIRELLAIPAGYRAILPIIVGPVKEFPPFNGRTEPKILSWKSAPVPVLN